MKKIFILTESRTVAKTIAQSLGVNIQRKGYYSKGDISVSWTGGNIVTAKPKSRFEFSVSSDMTADETFAANYRFSPRVKRSDRPSRADRDASQLSVIRRLWQDSDIVFNAMKPSAFGEVMFESMKNFIGSDTPTSRLWLRRITRTDIEAAVSDAGHLPTGYGQLHDNAIAEFTIGVKPEDAGVAADAPSDLPWGLPELQNAAESRLGLSPSATVAAAMSLYNKGLISYPSASNILPPSVAADISEALAMLRHNPSVGKYAEKAEVTGNEDVWTAGADGLAHYAITVTGLLPVDLTADESRVYKLVAVHLTELFTK